MARKTIEKNIAYDDVRKLYYVTLSYGKDADGKYQKHTVTTGNQKEARRILRNHMKAKAAGTLQIPSKDSFISFCQAFIDYKALDLEESTIYGYRKMLENHIAPFFKNDPLHAVTLQRLQEYRIQKSKNLSANTIGKHFTLMRSALQDAYKKQLIPQNPVDLMDRVKSAKSHKLFMNTEEIVALCNSVMDTQLELPVLLAVYLGLRRGEVLGLRWSDIDFEKCTVKIQNNRTKAGGKIIEKDPKTEKSLRMLCMSPAVIHVLRKAREQQKETAKNHIRYQNSGYVVVNANGHPFSPNYLSSLFHEHICKNDMKRIRYHDLRHAFASIANSHGVSMMEISIAMGHSNLGTTYSIYTHDFQESYETAVNAVAKEIEKAKLQMNVC